RKVLIVMIFVPLLISSDSNMKEEQPVQLNVSVATSLMNVMNEIEVEFKKQHEGISLQFIYGSSAKLAKQIEQGAPVDIFLSASSNEMDELVNKNKVIASTVQYFS